MWGRAPAHASGNPASCTAAWTLWRMLTVISTAVKASIAAPGTGCRRRCPAGPRSGRPGPPSPRGSGWSEQTRTSAAMGADSFSISEAGRWWNEADTTTSEGRPAGGRHGGRGAASGPGTPSLLDQGVGIGHDDLPGHAPARGRTVATAPSRGSPSRRARRRRSPRWRRRDGQRPVGPRLDQAARHPDRRSASLDPSTTSSPAAARRTARPRPAGPVPPRIPIRMGHTLGTRPGAHATGPPCRTARSGG